MPDASPDIVLASRSPRRIELLTQLLSPLRFTFAIDPADIDETPHLGEIPFEYVRRCAIAKVSAVSARRLAKDQSRDIVVIGADTTVEVDGRILGQPADISEAAEMLRWLSGRTHQVHTAVSIHRGDRQVDGVDTALVTMVLISPDVLTWYLQTEESLGKAGAYAAQGEGKRLVDRIDGDLGTVIGLPIGLVCQLAGKVSLSWKVGR